MGSTVDYYHRRRNELLWRIADGIPRCAECGTFNDLEIHHVGGGNGRRRGGWQHIYQVEDELENGTAEHRILCRDCHLAADAERRRAPA